MALWNGLNALWRKEFIQMVRMTYEQRDLVCFSHLRWNFVFQRPQHLLTRAASSRRCFFVEEPVFEEALAHMAIRNSDGVWVATPHLPHGLNHDEQIEALRNLVDDMFVQEGIEQPAILYWTPMALPFTRHLSRASTVFDCMDELSLFHGAPPALIQLESEMFELADVVFTGGHSLYEAKRHRHHNIHALPSSVDASHFKRAREVGVEPQDQSAIPHPRIGFFGVIDERLDTELLAGLADLRPDLHLVMLGPVVKISEDVLPRRPNIHWLGGKSYQELPAYLASWDVAILPFARNDSTRFISPTKTPEYLAGGKPVVSTSIKDVVQPYAAMGLVRIADTPEEFSRAIDEAMKEDSAARLTQVDSMLAINSWDRTWARMGRLIDVASSKQPRLAKSVEAPALAVGAGGE